MPRVGTFTLLSDLMKPKRMATPLERQAIAEVLDLAVRFAAGDCSLGEVRAATTPKQRNLATRFSTPKDVAWLPLMAMLDALIIESKTVIVTNQGVFLLGDLIDAGMKIVHEDGREVIQFPIYWPWRVKPDPGRGMEGEHGDPIYRRTEDRGPDLGSFRQVQAPTPIRHHEPEWWEAESTDEVPF